VVATGDTTVRGNVLAAGGEAISPEDLRAWIERCQTRVGRALATRAETQRKSFGNKLPL
jgi:hypothetical protein